MDRFGRKIDYLRVSVIDRCDLRCIYCMPEGGVDLLPRDEILSYEEILAVAEAGAGLGISKVRLTGGEPLIRRDLLPFIDKLMGVAGLKDVSMTTNGLLLKDFAVDLFEAGIKRINIGVDTLDPETYRKISRGGDVKLVIAGMKAALAAGMSPVKINSVVLKGMTDDLGAIANLTRELPVHVRFIEYMPVTHQLGNGYYVPAAEITERLKRLGPLEEVLPPPGSGPARRYYKLKGALGSIGLISAISEHFCEQCNRLRLTADGKLRLCLFSDEEINLKPALRPVRSCDKVAEAIKKGVARKPKQYKLDGRDENGRMMSQIGG